MRKHILWPKNILNSSSKNALEVFVNNTNITFLIFLYKISIEMS